MNVQPLLTHIAKYVTLTSHEESILLSQIKFRKYLKNQYIVQQGDICKYFSFVVSGCVRVFHLDYEGKEHIIRFAIEDWWVGDLGSFVEQVPAIYNVQCLENTEVFQVSIEKLNKLYLEVPRIERLFRILFQDAFIASEKRIVNNFSLTAKERYLNLLDQSPDFMQRVPQYMIASYLGITKEFLSKIRNQLTFDQ